MTSLWGVLSEWRHLPRHRCQTSFIIHPPNALFPKSATRVFQTILKASLHRTREGGGNCWHSFFILVTFFYFGNFHNRFSRSSKSARPEPMQLLARIAQHSTLDQSKPRRNSQTFPKFLPEEILNSFCSHFVEISRPCPDLLTVLREIWAQTG